MANIRIIPRMDIKGPHLVKGIHLEGLRVLGTPGFFAQTYYEEGADELFYQDIVASLYERNSLDDIIAKTASNIFIPLTVGGGLRTLEDIKRVLRCGADKVSINTAAVKNPHFIQEAAMKFGSSTIVVAIEAIRNNNGKYFAFTDNGREPTGLEAVEWAIKAESLGAGEILVTSVDNEGTGKGFDAELTKSISQAVNIPVIAHGGMGSLQHAGTLLGEIKDIDAICVSSALHYRLLQHHRNVEPDISAEGNIDFLKSGGVPLTIHPLTIREIKSYLHKTGIECRMDSMQTS